MLRPPRGTIQAQELNDMPWNQFDELVITHLDFTRDNSFVWRALTGPHVIERTMAALTRLRQNLEAGIRSSRIPDTHPAYRHRDLLHCRQEQARSTLKAFRKIDQSRTDAQALRSAIAAHRTACEAQGILPEEHDLTLWQSVADHADQTLEAGD